MKRGVVKERDAIESSTVEGDEVDAGTPSKAAKAAEPSTPSDAPPMEELPSYGFLYPFLVGTGGLLITMFVAAKADEWVGANVEPGGYGGSIAHERNFDHGVVGFALWGYLAFLLVARTVESGGWSFFDALWACNIALGVAGLGFVLGRPRLVAASVAVVTLDQMLWFVETIAYFITGRWGIPAGVSGYLEEPQNCTPIRLATTWHHLFFLPVCGYFLHGHGGFQWPAFLVGHAIFATIVPLARLTIPKYIRVEGVEGPVYMNVNISYELWRDVPGALFHALDNKPAAIFVPYMSVVGQLTNAPAYALLVLLSRFIES